MDKKIPYNKKSKGKMLSSGGPRDIQRKQGSRLGIANVKTPDINIDELKKQLISDPKIRKELKNELRSDLKHATDDVAQVLREEIRQIETGSGLPFDVVQKKIEDAVNHTQEQLKEKYKSIIDELSTNINTISAQLDKYRIALIGRTNEIDKLNMNITVLEKEITSKEEALERSENERLESVNSLKNKVTSMLEKIVSGEVVIKGRELVDQEGRSQRPTLEDVFIDPLEELSKELDVHIQIDEFKPDESESSGRDIKTDVEKLKHLLNKNKK